MKTLERVTVDNNSFEKKTNLERLHNLSSILEALEADRESREYPFLMFLNNFPGPAWIEDLQGRFIFVSKEWTRTSNITADEAIGKTRSELFKPGAVEDAILNDQKVLLTGDIVETLETESVSGIDRTWRVRRFPIRNEHGYIILLGGIAVEYTDLIKLEKAFLQNEMRMRALLNHTLDAIIQSNEGGTIVYANPAAENMFGYTLGGLIGRDISDLMPERFRRIHDKSFNRFIRTGESNRLNKITRLVGLRSNKEEFPIDVALTAWVQDGKKQIVAVIREVIEESPKYEIPTE